MYIFSMIQRDTALGCGLCVIKCIHESSPKSKLGFQFCSLKQTAADITVIVAAMCVCVLGVGVGGGGVLDPPNMLQPS